MARTRVYIQPFTPAGVYSGTWIEVTNDLIRSSLGKIQRRLDVSDYDVGVFTNSSISLKLRNDHGRYSDVGTSFSIFSFRRSDSLVKITWDLADWDFFTGLSSVGDIVGSEVTIFQGLLSDDATTMQARSQVVAFTVLGYESIFERTLAPTWVGTPPADNKASTLLKAAIAAANAGFVQPILTIDNSQIVPMNDVVWDDLSAFSNQTCKDAINAILEASNSVLYIPAVTPIVSGRNASADVKFHFFGPSASGAENIIDLQDIRNGINRTFNFVAWTGSTVASSDATSLATYGIRKKEVSVQGITNSTTQQSIVNALRSEFATPKQELVLITPLTYAALALNLLDQVDIDLPQIPVDAASLSIYDIAQYGVNSYAAVLSELQILTSEPYKIMSISIDPTKNSMSFGLRRVA